MELSGDGVNLGLLRDEESIENPADMLEEDSDDDPEILEEIDARYNEIIEQFMEMSYQCKMDAEEIVMASNELTHEEIEE